MNDKIIMPTENWLFDFDGTLVDSMRYWAEGMISVLDNHGIKYGDDIIKIITPLGTKGTAEYFQSIGLNVPIEEIHEEVFGFLTPIYQKIIGEKKGVRQCLKRMKEQGYRLHVLTASPHEWLDPCLKRLGLFSLFENVWSCDDFGTGKTNPDIYVEAAKRIGASVSEVTFLDDNINADKAAKIAGMSVVGVYDASTAESEEEMRQLNDGYIYDFCQLEKAIFKS